MRYGFSLVELSIVLVILGLLTGGILTGQSLIRAAELRSITTDFNRYQTAVRSFRDKYFAMPGDMRNATRFWATDPDGCPTHAVQVTKKETCDGDGNGFFTDDAEAFRFWQHLANAGLVEGSYSGVAGTGSSTHAVIGLNVPTTKLSNVSFTANYFGITSGSATQFATEYGNIFEFGGSRSNGRTIDPILTPEEAWNIDTKIDDGKPGYGLLIAYNWNECTLAVRRIDLDAAYDLQRTDKPCSFYFRKLF
ncbi:MAG: hypothetical protein CMM93_05555 [Rickettsiales bacterium]|nr:hypothetical protein [Rickettsiales bacterium]|tara:strand:- start:235 stop:984 length:750 start_codon:yes stop_codon:yes gene_type:complete